MRKKYNKYHNKKTAIDGITFDSLKEGRRYTELKQLQTEGFIKEFACQPVFVLQEGYRRSDGKAIRPIKYIADFLVVYPDGSIEYEDVKSPATAADKVFLIKRKLLESKYKLILRIV